jgi:hypothetical protein
MLTGNRSGKHGRGAWLFEFFAEEGYGCGAACARIRAYHFDRNIPEPRTAKGLQFFSRRKVLTGSLRDKAVKRLKKRPPDATTRLSARTLEAPEKTVACKGILLRAAGVTNFYN